MKALAVALESFEPVSRRDGKVIEFGDGMELGEFAQGDTLDVRWEGSCFPFLEEKSGFPASK